jgi:FimV-like protein
MPQRIVAVVDSQSSVLNGQIAASAPDAGTVSASPSPAPNTLNRVEALIAQQQLQQQQLSQNLQQTQATHQVPPAPWQNIVPSGMASPSAGTVALVVTALLGAALLVWIFPRLQVLWESLRFGRGNAADQSQPPSSYDSQWDQMDVLVDRYTSGRAPLQPHSGIDHDVLRADAAALPEMQPMPSYRNQETADVEVETHKAHSQPESSWDDMPVVVARDDVIAKNALVQDMSVKDMSANSAVVQAIKVSAEAEAQSVNASLGSKAQELPKQVHTMRQALAQKRAVRTPPKPSVLRPQMVLREEQLPEADEEPITSPMPLDIPARVELPDDVHGAALSKAQLADDVPMRDVLSTDHFETMNTDYRDSSIGPLESYDTQMELAQEFVQLGQYDEAISMYQEIITHAAPEQVAHAHRLLQQVPSKYR